MEEIKQIIRDKQFKKLFVGDTDNTLIQFFLYFTQFRHGLYRCRGLLCESNGNHQQNPYQQADCLFEHRCHHLLSTVFPVTIYDVRSLWKVPLKH